MQKTLSFLPILDGDHPEWKISVSQYGNSVGGDGNEIQVAMEFPNENLIVLLEGTYSSHDETDWYDVSFGYKPATQADLRDMKINDILN